MEEDVTEKELKLFNELKTWRKKKYIEEGFYTAYMVFNDRELCDIVDANISKKEDLKRIKGIGPIKYEKYARELYDIIIGI